jgi:hypothetical protein
MFDDITTKITYSFGSWKCSVYTTARTDVQYNIIEYKIDESAVLLK